MSTAPWLQVVRSKRRTHARIARASLVLFLWATAVVAASAPGEEAGAPSQNPVRIQSEQLVAEMATDTAEFSGAVRVEGDGYTITADSITIQFRPGTVSQNRSGGTISAKEISRMTARGRVRIQTETLTATAGQAVYDPDSGRLWLLATDEPSPAKVVREGQRKPATGHREAQAAHRASAPRVQVILQPTAGR
jgi:lipopolysaccharide export system protein LptA